MGDRNRTKRTPSELVEAIHAMSLDDELERIATLSDADLDAEVRALGGDPAAIRGRGAAFAKTEIPAADALAKFQRDALERLTRALEAADKAPKTPALPRKELLAMVDRAMKRPSLAAPMSMAFKGASEKRRATRSSARSSIASPRSKRSPTRKVSTCGAIARKTDSAREAAGEGTRARCFCRRECESGARAATIRAATRHDVRAIAASHGPSCASSISSRRGAARSGRRRGGPRGDRSRLDRSARRRRGALRIRHRPRELGHGKLDAGVVDLGSCALGKSDGQRRVRETRANDFAAEVKMPERLFVPFLQSLGGEPGATIEQVFEAADAFGMPDDAIALRMLLFTNLACAAVVSVEGRVKWWACSARFTTFVPWGARVDERTFAAKLHAGGRIPRRGQTLPRGAWERSDDARPVHEQAVRLRSGAVLSWLIELA